MSASLYDLHSHYCMKASSLSGNAIRTTTVSLLGDGELRMWSVILNRFEFPTE